ncbi:MAG: M28 family peptidase [Thermoanaerobaculia bacterium]
MSHNRTLARSLPLAALLGLGAAATRAQAPALDLLLPDGALAAAQEIDEATLRAPIEFLADDLLGGRGPGSPGDRLAQLYLATQLAGSGYEAGGPDGSWLQPVELVSVTASVPKTWSFQATAGGVDLATWDDFIAGSGVQSPTAGFSDAEVVFVGYGIQAPEYGWDDYKGTDLRGKVLLMMNNDPDWDPELFEGERRLWYGRWDYKYISAARQGAAGAIVIHTTPSAGYPFQVVQTSWSGPQFELPAGDEPRVQVQSWVTEDAARRLAALGGHDLDRLREAAKGRDFQPVPLGITTSLALTNALERSPSANVAGLLRGSDPELADEVVIFTAHHDHLGVGAPDAEGDAIYNGAMDNASGCAQLLAIARAAAALERSPRRSVLFLFVAAEEQGLLGSEYYALHPTFPAGKIAANVNLDGANIWGRTRDITYVGYGKSSLDAAVDAVAAYQGRTVEPDQLPDRGFFYRSDQFNFAKIGVPAVYLDGGTDFVGRPAGWGKERIEEYEALAYHQPSDELSADWDFEGIIDDARLAFLVGMAIAEADALPSWIPGDEFETARQAALAAAD